MRVERLGDEIVGAGFESLDAILGLLERGDQHDRNQPRTGVGLQRPADVEAVGRRHHHVEQHQVRRVAPDPLEGRGTARDGVDAVAVAGQQRSHEAPVGFDVVDDEDPAER